MGALLAGNPNFCSLWYRSVRLRHNRSRYFNGESAGIMKRFADATYQLLRRIFENGAMDLLSLDDRLRNFKSLARILSELSTCFWRSDSATVIRPLLRKFDNIIRVMRYMLARPVVLLSVPSHNAASQISGAKTSIF